MNKVLALVEGLTEFNFVRDVVAPELALRGIRMIPRLVMTSNTPAGRHRKGGSVTYARIRKQLHALCGDSSAALVTTLFDLYAVPRETPGLLDAPRSPPHERVAHVERAIHRDVGRGNLRVYLQLHEFEALLFADIARLVDALPDTRAVPRLLRARDEFPSPEHIDDHPATRPSQRLLDAEPRYRKPLHGPITASAIGFAKLRAECPHFRDWLSDVENLRPTPIPDPPAAPSRQKRTR